MHSSSVDSTILRLTRSELQEQQKPDLGRKYAVEAFTYTHALLAKSCFIKDSQSVIGDRWTHRLSSGYGCLSSMVLVCRANTSSKSRLSMSLSRILIYMYIALRSFFTLLILRDIDISGLVAHVDLFAVKSPPPSSELSRYSPLPYHSPVNNGDGCIIIPPQRSSSCQQPAEDGSAPPNTISSCTNAIFGSSFVHVIQIDWQGQPMVFFVFSDLSVRFEGPFCMRYRCFDLFR